MTTLRQKVELGAGWDEVLGEEFDKPYMEALAHYVQQERASGSPIYPPAPQVFTAFRQTPYELVKVVIMGQDPYHGPGQAMGMCFSVPEGVAIPPSLKNIYKEIHADLGLPIPTHGNLMAWAQQGVLLLNATLTVRAGQPKSHFGQGWEHFTDAAIRSLLNRDVIFVLWGSSARQKVENVIHQTHANRQAILTAPHPSPLSAHRGFLGCRHFSKVNELLLEKGKASIDWSVQ